MTRQEKSTLRLCQLREPRDARRLLTKLVGEITAGPERLSGVAGARGGAAEPSRTQTLLSASRKTFAHIGKTPHTHRASRLSPRKAARPRYGTARQQLLLRSPEGFEWRFCPRCPRTHSPARRRDPPQPHRSAASSERGPALRCEPNCAVLCYSMLCRAMLCYSTPCCVVLCPAITCRTVPCHSAMPRRTTRRCTARSVPDRTTPRRTAPYLPTAGCDCGGHEPAAA